MQNINDQESDDPRFSDIQDRLLKLEEAIAGIGHNGGPPLREEVFDPEDVGLSEEEAAPILGVTVATLRCWRSLGRGPRYRKTGKHIEYTPRFIKEYQQTSTRTPEPASVRRQRRALPKQQTAEITNKTARR
jgi:hypothetical protein